MDDYSILSTCIFYLVYVKKRFGVLIGIVIAFAVVVNVLAVFWLEADQDNVVTSSSTGLVDGDNEPEVIGSLFTVDDGMRVDNGSNPMVTYQDEEKLILAYEYRSEELRFAPGVDAPLIVTYDGLNFDMVEDRTGLSVEPPGVLIDGVYHKYIFQPSDGVMYTTSQTNLDYQTQGVALDVHAQDASDAREFGVYTYFVDDQGGVVLLFNSTDANGDVVVNRAYASPDDLSTLEVTDRDILDSTLEYEWYADPNAIVLDDGRIALIVMNQDDGPLPPAGRQGSVHLYLSDDAGTSFDYAGELFSWDDFDEFEVRSLNDPKIVQFADGSLRVYVAAMVPDESKETTDDPSRGYKWILVSATGELE